MEDNHIRRARGCFPAILDIYVTSFSSISYCNNSEIGLKKNILNDNIHSTILDVHVLKTTYNSKFETFHDIYANPWISDVSGDGWGILLYQDFA